MTLADRLERDAVAALRNIGKSDRKAILAWLRYLEMQARKAA